MQRVAVIGASPKPDRYAYKAASMLRQHGHQVVLVSPVYDKIDEEQTVASVEDVDDYLDTVTMYIGADKQPEIINGIIQKKPARVIFNPGTENPDAYARLEKAGIGWEEACTLVLLQTNQFE